MSFDLTLPPGRWDRMLIPVMILSGLAAAVAVLDFVGVRVNWTRSEPVGVYWVHPVTERIRVGQMIEFCPPVKRYPFMLKGRCPGGTEPFFKEVVGAPGDIVTVSDLGVTVNGAMLSDSRPHRHARSDASILLPVLRGTFKLGKGQYWAYGSGLPAESFDSRYWGPVEVGAVAGVTNVLGGVASENGLENTVSLTHLVAH